MAKRVCDIPDHHDLVNCVTMPELAKNKQYNGEKSPGDSEKNVKIDPLIDIRFQMCSLREHESINMNLETLKTSNLGVPAQQNIQPSVLNNCSVTGTRSADSVHFCSAGQTERHG